MGRKPKGAGEVDRRERAVLAILSGADPAAAAREADASTAEVEAWRERFLAAGRRALRGEEGHGEESRGEAAAGEPPSFRAELLGAPRVLRRGENGEDELVFRLRKAFGIFAFLLLSPQRRARRDELVEVFWAHAGDRTVRRNFHPTLSALRRTLAGRDGPSWLLRLHDGRYLLAPEARWEVDVDRFRVLTAAAKASRESGDREAALTAYRGAWKLYRGPLLEGDEAAWVQARRAPIQRLYLDVLAALGELSGELGLDLDALDAYRALLIEEPFAEHVHQAVMELYARRGRRDLVRRQFVRLQELLKELNVQPGEATQERYHELMR